MNKYLRHIKNLCQRHHITLYMGKEYHAYIKDNTFEEIINNDESTPTFSLLLARTIAIPHIHNRLSYFGALHEIGHILGNSPLEYPKFECAFSLGKVTRHILTDEYRASAIGLKLNKYVPAPYFKQMASNNQANYIAKYESDWNTKLKSRLNYMTFIER